MIENFKFTLKIIMSFSKGFIGMNNLRRWTEFFQANHYNELSKQALNCIVTFLLAKQIEHKGNKVIWKRFPKIAMFRVFQKMGLADVTDATYASIVAEMNKELESFYVAVGNEKIKEMVLDSQESEDLQVFLLESADTTEFKIYKAASAIATFIEVIECELEFSKNDFARKYAEVNASIINILNDFPETEMFYDVDSDIFKLLQKLSGLRNQNRWAVRSYTVSCSVLGHLFDTAIYAYMLSYQHDEDEDMATNMFFMGIWHDVAECWTKDIPSPTKDSFPGFRQASENFELKCIEQKIYNKVPNWMADEIKAVMMEDEANKDYKKLLKAADYLSADSECYRQLFGGSRDFYFKNILDKDKKKIEDDEKSFITGSLKELVDFYVRETQNLHLLH